MILHNEDEKGNWFFTEVLDSLMLYYVISIEIKQEMSNHGVEYISDDEDDNKIKVPNRLKS